jgi:hypothetical protein
VLKFERSTLMADFMEAEGIFHEKTVPHEHHQNGAVERVNQTLLEMARSLLPTKRLPAYLLSATEVISTYLIFPK